MFACFERKETGFLHKKCVWQNPELEVTKPKMLDGFSPVARHRVGRF